MNPKVERLLQAASAGRIPLYFLFPGKGALPLDQIHETTLIPTGDRPEGGSSEVGDGGNTDDPAAAGSKAHFSEMNGSASEMNASASRPNPPEECDDSLPKYLLMAVDGTWRKVGWEAETLSMFSSHLVITYPTVNLLLNTYAERQKRCAEPFPLFYSHPKEEGSK
jgi:hypothetical protein